MPIEYIKIILDYGVIPLSAGVLWVVSRILKLERTTMTREEAASITEVLRRETNTNLTSLRDDIHQVNLGTIRMNERLDRIIDRKAFDGDH